MKKTIIIILIFFTVSANAQWDVFGSYPKYDLVQSFFDQNNNTYINIQANNGSQTYFFKYSSTGNLVYKIEKPYNRFLMNVDHSGYLYLHERSSDLMQKYDLYGNLIWEKYIPHRDEIYFDSNNNLIIGFYISSKYCLAKYSPEGDVIWLLSDSMLSIGGITILKNDSIFAYKISHLLKSGRIYKAVIALAVFGADGSLTLSKDIEVETKYLNTITIDDQHNIYIPSDTCVVKYSKNLEPLWQINVGFNISKITISDNNTVCALGRWADTINRSYAAGISSDGNLLWKLPFLDGYTELLSVSEYKKNNFFIAGYSSKDFYFNSFVKYLTPSKGVQYTFPLSSSIIRNIKIHEEQIIMVGGLYSSIGNGFIIHSFKNFLTTLEIPEEIPYAFSLSQNYPNPFNPETTIDYQLSTPGFVTLKVYDLLGREVATLVDEYKQAGFYNYKFSIINFQLTSGVYFYRLQAGSFSETKKLILMK